tara:strand:- start:325 stop:480 length:156 start_codon:yes stop_codon:yes gene_type:complete
LGENKKMLFQKYNKKTGSYVKMKKLKSGRIRILDVKEKKPKTPFKSIRVRK